MSSRLRGVSAARWTGWGGIALGVLAFYLALPPLLVRTPLPSLVLAVAGVVAGVTAMRAGERRLGWGAVVAAVVGTAGAACAPAPFAGAALSAAGAFVFPIVPSRTSTTLAELADICLIC